MDKPTIQLPHKRPRQTRARFTVKTIYDGFVRIWRSRGPAAATTRAIAEETGFAVGTLYEYFPNSTALLSGYVRYCIDREVERIRESHRATQEQPWRDRLRQLIRLTAGADPETPYFDRQMLLREHEIAADKHHRGAFDKLSEAWVEVISSWPDLPGRPGPENIRLMFVMVWGARRYRLLAQVEERELGDWLNDMYSMCLALLENESDQGKTTM